MNTRQNAKAKRSKTSQHQEPNRVVPTGEVGNVQDHDNELQLSGQLSGGVEEDEQPEKSTSKTFKNSKAKRSKTEDFIPDKGVCAAEEYDRRDPGRKRKKKEKHWESPDRIADDQKINDKKKKKK